MIKKENMRINSHVEAVLKLSRSEKKLKLNKKNIFIKDIIDDAIDRMGLSVKSKEGNISLKYSFEGKLYIYVDKFHIGNVIMNILDNAVKYSKGIPKIDILVENIDRMVQIRIKDQGIGMTKSVQNKIFDKFYRVPTGNIHNVGGYGLGLSYSKRIVESHKGSISVTSSRGLGSTFIINLPIKHD